MNTLFKIDERYGSYNDFPPNWKPATDDEFWNRFMVYDFKEKEYRQMFRLADGSRSPKMIQAKLFLYSDGIGLAMVSKVVGARHVAPELYKFAICEHLNRKGLINQGTYRTSECVDCGQKFSVDSSD